MCCTVQYGHARTTHLTTADSMTYEPPAGILIGPATMPEVKAGDRIAELIPADFAEIHELGKAMIGPTLVPVGIVRAVDATTDKSFTQVFDAWIGPEVARRVQAGVPAESLLPIQQAVIVFPPKSAPERHRVLLNGEADVHATLRPSYGAAFAGSVAGDTTEIRLRDMFDLRSFALAGVDMQADGFVWIRPERDGWALYFNFIPNCGATGISPADRTAVMRSVQTAIAQEMLQTFLHGVFAKGDQVRSQMTRDGWCPTPILLPEPWKEMTAAYASGKPDEAGPLAIAAVGIPELDTMAATWIAEEPFASDRAFLERGIERYKAGDYISAISVLLPRIEGLANRVREKRGIGARENLAQVFGELDQLASADVRDGYLATRIREEFSSLIANFLLIRFSPSAPQADLVRGRHAHSHGATGDPQYDQPYALKIILALDALYFISR